MIDAELQHSVDKAWESHTRLKNPEMSPVVRNSIPILFFGDLDRYCNSSLKVVTVGLNPSDIEFRKNKKEPIVGPSLRFPRAQHLDPAAKDDGFYEEYIAALSAYFRENPYRQWFAWYEHVLLGMESSFYSGTKNTAIHTDLFSPLATNPTWGGLTDEQRERLGHSGTPLWHRLIEYLDPHVVIASIANSYIAEFEDLPVANWEPIHTVTHKVSGELREKPYRVLLRRCDPQSGKPFSLVHGPAANTPFGTVSAADRRKIGASIIKEYNVGR